MQWFNDTIFGCHPIQPGAGCRVSLNTHLLIQTNMTDLEGIFVRLTVP